mgnify:CR=1 FL=1
MYGSQAVVISVDPRRVYVEDPSTVPFKCIKVGDDNNGSGGPQPGPNGEQYCWYRCTTKGARGTSEIDVPTLVTACAELGAGEIMVNLIDNDGVCNVRTGCSWASVCFVTDFIDTSAVQGFDSGLLSQARAAANIPVIASSGAGRPAHFAEVFELTDVEAALGAGIFHRRDVEIADVKAAVEEAGFATVAGHREAKLL